MSYLKALLLIPVAFAGAFSGLALQIRPRLTADIVMPFVLLSPIYAAIIAILVRMWRRPAARTFLGHSRGVWTFLMAVAFVAGLACMLAGN